MKMRFLSRFSSTFILFCVASILTSFISCAQSKVTFSIDVQDLIDSGYYKQDDKIIIRGSFNDWSGMDFELSADDNNPARYSQRFDLDVNEGEKAEYKYLLVSADDIEYWEDNPNPENPGYGNRILEVTGTEMVLPLTHFVYGKAIRGRVLPWEEKLRADFRQARVLLEENHPALYDYSSKEFMDSLFEHYYDMIDASMDFITFYQNLSVIMAHIGCGHTKLWMPESYWESTPDKFFPLKLIISDEMVMISGSYTGEEIIPIGSEIIAINEKPINEIMAELREMESSDGFIESFKISTIQKRFPYKYAMMYGFPDQFNITYIPPDMGIPGVLGLPAMSRDHFKSVPRRGDELSFKQIDGYDLALMTINTFSYYSEVPMFRAFIDSSFQVLVDQNIGHLIIDLRGNDGGDPYCASYMFSYLQKEAVPYFIESYHHYDTLARPIHLPDKHYKGRTYIIIDGGGFSTTGHVCGLMKYHKLVTFVGTELGATYTCTGNVMYPNLDHTRIICGTAQGFRYTVAVEGMDPMQGVLPDRIVETSQQDIVEGRDAQMEYILNIIKN